MLEIITQEIIASFLIGIAIIAFVWVLFGIISRVNAKKKKFYYDEKVRQINEVVESISRKIEGGDNDISALIVEAENLMNDNIDILGTDFLLLLDKHLNALKKRSGHDNHDAKALFVDRLSKKVERKITKGLFTDKKTSKQLYKNKGLIDVSSVKHILEDDDDDEAENAAKAKKYSLSATQEFDKEDLDKLLNKE